MKTEESLPTTFGDKLRQWRLQAGLTQDGLAEAAGNICTGAYISTLERGADKNKKGHPIKPGEHILDALAEPLGVPVSVLRLAAGYAAELSALDDEVSALMLGLWAEMNADTRGDVLAIVQTLWRRRRQQNADEDQRHKHTTTKTTTPLNEANAIEFIRNHPDYKFRLSDRPNTVPTQYADGMDEALDEKPDVTIITPGKSAG